jgi:hypothetical protein
MHKLLHGNIEGRGHVGRSPKKRSSRVGVWSGDPGPQFGLGFKCQWVFVLYSCCKCHVSKFDAAHRFNSMEEK